MTNNTRPQVIMEREDYSDALELLFLDIKARWAIHQYEMKELGEDLSSLGKFISEKTSQFSDTMYYTWTNM